MIEDPDAGGEDCPTGQLLCDGVCTITRNDPDNCGSCGNACDSGEVCSDSVCGANCPTGQTLCEGGCFDTDTEEEHCGACGTACETGETCTDGDCMIGCPSGQELCGDTCVTTSMNLLHCGGCNQPCDAGEACADGECAAACPVGQRVCGDACVNTNTDEDHCGDCDDACDSGEICVDGSCETSCPASQTECDGLCFDLESSRTHCGACETACADGEACVGGDCTIVCPVGQIACGGACVDTSRDAMHCGSCGNDCSGGTPLCIGGSCAGTCGAGLDPCSGACVDTDNDRNHCGACGNACTAAQVCTAGVCTASTCPAAAPVPRWTGPGCSTATLDCLAACTDGACQDACLASAGADCNNCLGQNWISCGNANGCGTDFNCLDQCVTANACPTYGCAACTAQFTPYDTCLNALPPEACNDALLECFASSCPEQLIPLWTGTACSSATVTCINACPDDDGGVCAQACLDADVNAANCNGCINQNLVSCFNAAGCQAEWNCLADCDDTTSPDGCASLADRYDACVDTVPDLSVCNDEFVACFP